ncbi:hypothetical protein MgSA37_01787 [Mucilaginibacter gotjawali]|uniref:Uncharacterized protein n=1 Tax=Mucilaginibacter gotjawali TaxID=1550579 RepID=A0A110B297_9SPHI|nr:hypothetical protein MgSA37_01787 [Mucilaginibacter gotjawali]
MVPVDLLRFFYKQVTPTEFLARVFAFIVIFSNDNNAGIGMLIYICLSIKSYNDNSIGVACL